MYRRTSAAMLVAVLTLGCAKSEPPSDVTSALMEEAQHEHYHVHAADVSHEHSHENEQHTGHLHVHSHESTNEAEQQSPE